MQSVSRNILSAFLMVMFIVVSITGVMMYFKIRIFSAEALHIWLGFLFVGLSSMHLLKNWSAFCSYFKKRSTFLSLSAGIIICCAFIIPPLFSSAPKEVSPKSVIIGTMMNAPLAKVALFVDLDVYNVIEVLKNKNIVADMDKSISQIAKVNNKPKEEILGLVFSTLNK
ncbi:MAG: DUF4405 domain-containing protein [Sulfurospirillaceae bacterium]|nr:DUF4405 domain-containing protein [Sulfurospirillaceae bacterium]MDD3463823.1 DUF4405 domain-containing protein [Sulfurospirillaceae bacterium]